MAEMFPRCTTDAEVDEIINGVGDTGERLLYKLMRDYLPDDWCVIWNKRISNSTTNHQYDFIVLVPGKGVLELDAKGHGYGYNNNGVLGCFHKQGFTPDPDLFNNVQGAKSALLNTLKHEFGNFGACNCLVAFIDQFVKDDKNPAASDWIDKIDERLRKDPKCLEKKIENLLSASINGLDLRNFHHYFDDKMMKEIKEFFAKRNGWKIHFQDDFYQWNTVSENYLSTRQAIIYGKAGNCSAMHVRGAAGTGKTIVAMALAKNFAKQGQKVLYVCFNRKLADVLKRRIRTYSNITVTNYDAVGGIRLDQNRQLKEIVPWHKCKNNMAYWTNNDWIHERNQIFNDLSNAGTQVQYFDILIVDEAQDLDNRYISALLFRLKKQDGKAFIFSDENQSLFSVNWSLETEKLFKPGTCKEYELEENWRNSSQIHKHFAKIMADQSVATFVGNVDVTTIKRNEVMDYLKKILKEGRNPENIALLTIGGVKINEFTAVPDGNGTTYNISENLDSWYDNKTLLKANVEGFKGLESDIVFLFGNQSLPEDNPAYQQREMDRYVGESRAKYELYIVEEN